MLIDIRSDGVRHWVAVGGVDVSNGVSSVAVRLDAGEPALASLEVALPVVEVVGAEAEVYVHDAARRLLIAAGWTPPSTEPDATGVA